MLRDGEARYFIRHVWLAEIALWLKAGREADARGVVPSTGKPCAWRSTRRRRFPLPNC